MPLTEYPFGERAPVLPGVVPVAVTCAKRGLEGGAGEEGASFILFSRVGEQLGP